MEAGYMKHTLAAVSVVSILLFPCVFSLPNHDQFRYSTSKYHGQPSTVDVVSDRPLPLHFRRTNPLHWIQGSIRSLRRFFIPKKVVFLPFTEPTADERPSVLLMVFPGSFKGPHDYVALCKSIQARASERGINVHVGIAKFFLNLAFLLTQDEFKDVTDVLRAGLPSDAQATFLMGHSLGATAAKAEGLNYQYDGVIVLSSICCSAGQIKQILLKKSLRSYPKPMLQVVGTHDAFVEYLALADELENLEQDIKRKKQASETGSLQALQEIEETALLEKPIVALEGVNHMHLADGKAPKLLKAMGSPDVSTPLSMEEAQCRVAATVSDFLVSQVSGRQQQEQCRKSLLEQVQHTMELLRPYRKLLEPSFVSQFLESIQTKMLNIKQPVRVSSRWHDSRSDFVYAKPSLSSKGDIVVDIVAQEPFRWSTWTQLSPTVAIKCKSQDAVLSQAKRGLKSLGPPLSLAELNAETFRQVLETHVTKEQRDRYEKEGRKLSFAPDRIIEAGPKAGPKWVDLSLGTEVCNKTGDILVQSPVLLTPTDIMPRQFAGMWYGKPLTPSQAYEWIVFSAFVDVNADR